MLCIWKQVKENNPFYFLSLSHNTSVADPDSSVAADPKVSPNWSLKTVTCHSSHCFSIVWG